MKDSFSQSGIQEFLDSLRQKSKHMLDLNDQLDMDENNCVVINEDLKFRAEEEKRKKREAVQKPKKHRNHTNAADGPQGTPEPPK